jgi:hypothetical protein
MATLLITEQVQSAVCTAIANGNWSNPAIWSCGSVPSCGDIIIIPASRTVNVNVQVDLDEPACTIPTYIQISGTLQFVTGNKINLACGSGVEIMPGGQMLPGGGGGSSSWLEICGVTEWRTADGPQFGYRFYGVPVPLSVDFISFSVKQVSNDIELKWLVGSERGNSHFDIEFSSDGEHWKLITSIASIGDHFENVNYEHVIKSFHQNGYFRLYAVDIYGERELLDTKSIKNVVQEMSVYPNPVVSGQDFRVLVPIEKEEIIEVRILNNYGQLVRSFSYSSEEIENSIHLSTTELSSGVYYVQILSPSINARKEVMVIK